MSNIQSKVSGMIGSGKAKSISAKATYGGQGPTVTSVSKKALGKTGNSLPNHIVNNAIHK
jgi:hypothetical protein